MVLECPDASVRLLVWLYFAWHGFWLKVALGCRHLLLMIFGGQPLSEGARTKTLDGGFACFGLGHPITQNNSHGAN